MCVMSNYFQKKRKLYDSALMDTTRSGNSTLEVDAYISEISEKATAYMSTDTVWNRDELKDALSSIVDKGIGVFCCLLGGKSTGKSLVLSELMKQNTTRSIAYVNLRLTEGILNGFISSLESSPSKFVETIKAYFSKLVSVKVPVLGSTITAGSSLSAILAPLLATKQTDMDKLSFLLEEVAKGGTKNAAGCGLTVIIDEANEAFTESPDKEAASDALSVFTALTKEKRKVSESICK